MWVAYFGPDWWKRLLSAAPLRQLGATSYAFYLTHGFALKVIRFGTIPLLGALADNPLVFWTNLGLGLALAIWTARLVYDLIENPLATRFARQRPLTPVGSAR